MQAEPKRQATCRRQRHVVAGQVHALKPVDLLEGREAVDALLAVDEILVHQIRDLAVGAGADGLRDERVGRRLVPVPDHGQDVDRARMRARRIAHQLDEADHLVLEERAEENAAVEERAGVLAAALEIHPVVRESPSLADGRLVVDVADALQQRVVERHLAKDDALLLGLPGPVARVGADLLREPVVERRHRQHGEVVPLHRVVVLRRRFGNPLDEREEVDPRAARAERVHHDLRVVGERELLPVEACHAEQPPFDLDGLSADVDECRCHDSLNPLVSVNCV